MSASFGDSEPASFGSGLGLLSKTGYLGVFLLLICSGLAKFQPLGTHLDSLFFVGGEGAATAREAQVFRGARVRVNAPRPSNPDKILDYHDGPPPSYRAGGLPENKNNQPL